MGRGREPVGGLRLLGWVGALASVLYVAIAVVWATQVTFYWDDYFLLLALDDHGLGGALLTGINGNWWPLATLGLQAQVVAFGAWYPGYLGTNAVLVVGSAWAGWFAFAPLARRRPWLLAAALAVYACSLGLIVNVTVMTMSWPLAAALALTAAALAVRGHSAWVWGGVLALAFLAESGLFLGLASMVAVTIVVTRMAQSRSPGGAAGSTAGWTAPARRDVLLATGLVLLGALGTFVGLVIANRNPIVPDGLAVGHAAQNVLGALGVGGIAHQVATFVPTWLATPLLAPMVVRPTALPWLAVLVSDHLVVVLAGVAIAGLITVRLWRRRRRDEDSRARWLHLAAAAVLTIPVGLTAVVLTLTRTGSQFAPRYAILWLLPAALAWVVLAVTTPPGIWVRTLGRIVEILLIVSAVVAFATLPWTFRAAFDIDLDRVASSVDQMAQMDRCRVGGPAVANPQVSPNLSDDRLCQAVAFLDRS